MKTNEKIVFPLILLAILVIFLLIPYKGYINKRVYDPKANYQIFKKISRDYVFIYYNLNIIRNNKNGKISIYTEKRKKISKVEDVEKLTYLETYIAPGSIHIDEFYNRILFSYKDKKYRLIYGAEIDEKTYLEYMKELSGRIEAEKKIKPFILKLQTPEEFYNNYKEYFFPYYLGDYEYKGNN